MARICVLGGGLVGRFVACALHERQHTVKVVDADVLSEMPIEIEVIQDFVRSVSYTHLTLPTIYSV